MRQIILISFFSLLTLSSYSQSIITGTVKDTKGELLIGVNIFLEGTYDGSTSDIDGKYTFTTDESGTLSLVASFIGYEEQKFNVDLNSSPIQQNFVLKEKFNEIKAVTITAGSFAAGDTKKATVLSSLEVVTTAGASGDISGAMQTLPGTTSNGEDGRLFVRGGTGEETQTYINGTIVQVPYSPSPPNTAVRGKFDPFMFSGILFSTGGYSAEYGQALSAALVLNTKEKAIEDLLDISIATIFGGLGGVKKFDKGSIRADIGYTNLAPYMKVAKQNLNWIKPFEGADGSLSIRRETKGNGLLKFYTSYNFGTFTLNSNEINSPTGTTKYDLTNNSFYTNLAWKGAVSEKWALMIGGSYTHDEQDIYIEADKLDKDLDGVHGKLVLKNQITEKINLKIGAGLMTKEVSQNYKNVAQDTTFAQGFKEVKPISFIESKIHATNELAFSIGVRAENSQLLNQATIAPRISAAYRLNEKNQISFAWGHFYQDPLDDYLMYSNKIKEEKADHYILNYQLKSKGRLLRAETYFKKYDQLVKITNSPEFYLEDSYDNSGHGYAYGLDLFYKDTKTIKNGTYWISYSFLETKRDFRDYPQEAIPNFAAKHNTSIVYKHWFPELKTMLSGTFKYGSPRRYNNPNKQEFNNESAKPYQSLDMSISYLYRQNIIFFASSTNVLGYKNVFGYEYSNTPDENGFFQRQEIRPSAKQFFFIGCFITLTKKGTANQLDSLD